MAKFIGWSTPVDLGHDAVDLGHGAVDLGHDVLDLVMMSWIKQEGRGRRSIQIPRQDVR
jgi:hypothetical protein